MDDNIIRMISESFQTINRVGSLVGFLIGFALCGLIFVWFRELIKRYHKTVIEIPVMKRIRSPLVVKPKISPAQYEVIQDLITDFKKVEKTAQAVPAYVLERYSEFFLHSLKRLQVNKQRERELKRIYPLLVGYHVECEMVKDGKFYLFETEVKEKVPSGVVLRYVPTLQFVIDKGDEMVIAYTVERFHFRGKVKVLEVRLNDTFVISLPREIYLSAERRYERLPFGIAVFLRDIRQEQPTKVLLMDLSWEGCRIRGPRLDKKAVYYLLIPREGGNIQLECVVGRELLRREDEYVYSLSFLYLPYEVRQELMRLLKEKALEIKLATTHPVSGMGKPHE
ncbi:MAG: PilZ domain-containing protein [Brevinematales bacterium]